MLDQLVIGLQQTGTGQANLAKGATALVANIQTIQANGQKAISNNIAALQKANDNRSSDWAKAANQDIENLLVKPLETDVKTAINYAAMGAAIIGMIPGLQGFMVVAGDLNLINAGISALEGNYMSAGLYALGGIAPAAPELADVVDLADGALPAIEDAVPAGETAIQDAGQEVADTLATDGVAAKAAGEVGSASNVGGEIVQLASSQAERAAEGERLLAGIGGPCFAAGTLVLTNCGKVPIEFLDVGRRVITQPAGMEEMEAMPEPG